MKHLKKGRKFGRERDQRRALMKSLASSFFMLGRITTTEAKARELRPFVEVLLTKAKRGSAVDQRILLATISRVVLKKILEVGKTMQNRPGGYTRIMKLGQRKTDGARMAIIELVK